MSLTIDQLIRKEDKGKVPAEVLANITKLLGQVNKLLEAYGSTPGVTSGYRTSEHNKKIGGSPRSAHMSGQAVDLADPKGNLKTWLRDNKPLVAKCELWLEHMDYTKGWVHLTTRKVVGHDISREFRP